jgi:hypothetical protein
MPPAANQTESAGAQAKSQPWKAFIKIEETNVAKNGPTAAGSSELRILAELDDKDLGG